MHRNHQCNTLEKRVHPVAHLVKPVESAINLRIHAEKLEHPANDLDILQSDRE